MKTIKTSKRAIDRLFVAPGGQRQPAESTLVGIALLSKEVANLEIDFDRNGQVRTMSTTCPNGLTKKDRLIHPLEAASDFIALASIRKVFQLEGVSLRAIEKKKYAFGQRLNFQQVASIEHLHAMVPVRGGTFSVAIDNDGRIFSVTSTIKRASQPVARQAIITADEAIERARQRFNAPLSGSSCQLVLSCHHGKMDIAYEVTLEGNFPREVIVYLVLARTGKIVNEEFRSVRSLYNYSGGGSRHFQLAQLGVLCRALLLTPDSSLPISAQTSMAFVSDHPAFPLLKNQYFEMLVGSQLAPIGQKSDGSYCYALQDSQFAAVSAFIALNRQLQFYLEMGLAHPGQSIKVVVDDEQVEDNAYFDSLRGEIHLGVGSGLKGRGLNKRIALDLGVINHEFGHAAIFWQAPANDLPGPEGAALHEAIGDVMGTLVMDYLCRIWYGNLIGRPFTSADLLRDPRMIGTYAMPPHGIRSQKNDRRAPQDMTGEPHTDGLIVGAALADTLVGMASLSANELEQQIKLYTRILLMAIALVPMGKVTFKDMLRAMIIADYEISGGLYREVIVKSFFTHGISLGALAKLGNDCLAFLTYSPAKAA
jgi:Zn-dependent metalloprotease